jgi:hypothetical protein
MAEIQQPILRANDKHGNVRPADDRFLSSAAKKKRDAYVAKVENAAAKAFATDSDKADPYAAVINDAVEQVLTAPDAVPAEPSTPVLDTEVTPVTSARGDNSDQPALPAAEDEGESRG